jgi:hypothetical protein
LPHGSGITCKIQEFFPQIQLVADAQNNPALPAGPMKSCAAMQIASLLTLAPTPTTAATQVI